uniref:Uncharacterized protein n=1 Tax=Anopheles atroparvus TaxID=41427 RepID=A0A182IVE3_ANOAO
MEYKITISRSTQTQTAAHRGALGTEPQNIMHQKTHSVLLAAIPAAIRPVDRKDLFLVRRPPASRVFEWRTALDTSSGGKLKPAGCGVPVNRAGSSSSSSPFPGTVLMVLVLILYPELPPFTVVPEEEEEEEEEEDADREKGGLPKDPEPAPEADAPEEEPICLCLSV